MLILLKYIHGTTPKYFHSRNIVASHAALCNSASLQADTIKKALQNLKADINSVSIITDVVCKFFFATEYILNYHFLYNI
jgi:hypothetical protein